MNSRKQRLLKMGAALLMLTGLSACGASKKEPAQSTEFASRAPNDLIVQNPNAAWAYCNGGSNTTPGFRATFMAFIEDQRIRNDLLYLRMSSLPSTFQSGSVYFQMFRWQANTSGSAYMDPSPLRFRLTRDAGGDVLANRDYLRWNEISTAASQMGVDVEEFFKRTHIIVDTRDPIGQFDVIRIVAYDNSTNQSVGELDLLMPVFHADPAAYDIEDGKPRSPLLTALHPFRDKRGQGWKADDYQTWSDAFCDVFR